MSGERCRAFRFGRWQVTAWAMLLLVGAASASRRQAPAIPQGAERISDNVYRIGRVFVDLKARTVTCEGKVNLRKGLIEYLAVADRGKLHESILQLDVQPLHLQVGLILLGLEPRGGLSVQGDTALPRGPSVDLWVVWESRGRESRARAEELIWDITRKRVMEQDPWVFSGSMVTPLGFAADRERSLIATYRDPAAIINNRHPSGADDSVYEANQQAIPAVGTRVQLVIQARQK